MLLTASWLFLSIVLDVAVGACLFLGYAQARKLLLLWVPHEFTSRPVLLEVAAGAVGGAIGGLVERPTRALAKQQNLRSFVSEICSPKWWKMEAFAHARFAVVRSTVGHAAFFGAFSASKALYTRLQREWTTVPRTTWSDAVTTSLAGCTAGAALRTANVPMQNWYLYLVRQRQGSLQDLLRTPRYFLDITFRGYRQALAYTMPVTGVAFLGYEFAIYRFT
jgi:hypothetical protein